MTTPTPRPSTFWRTQLEREVKRRLALPGGELDPIAAPGSLAPEVCDDAELWQLVDKASAEELADALWGMKQGPAFRARRLAAAVHRDSRDNPQVRGAVTAPDGTQRPVAARRSSPMPRPTTRQIAAKAAELRGRDTATAETAARERAQLGYEIALGEAPELRPYFEKIQVEREARRAPDTLVEPRMAGWGGDHGHLSVDARIDEQARQNRIAHWRETREGSTHVEDVVAAEPVLVRVTAQHHRAGVLRMMCDGEGWFVRVRGIDHGCGRVTHGERDFTEDGEPVYRPRPSVVEQAAQRALSDPEGPERPPGSVSFTSGPDGEIIEVCDPEVEDPAMTRPSIAKMLARVKRATA